MASARPMSAMISYQSRDRAAAELLHEELALRGFVVVHDQCTFLSGSRIATEMQLGVENCDAFVAYLTPESLYLDAQPGDPRPALDEEFRPAMDRRREPRPAGQGPCPVVLPVPKRLGTRSEAADTVFAQTGESIGALWMKGARPDDEELSQAEAAAIAREAVQATLRPNQRYVEEPVPLIFVTRGNSQPPRFEVVEVLRPLVESPFDKVGRVPLPDSPPAAYLSSEARTAIVKQAALAYPNETGGVLVGLTTQSGEPWVVEAVELESASPSPAAYQLPEGETQAAIESLREADDRLGYLGEWHSHPNATDRSTKDERTMHSLARDPDLVGESPLLFVARRKEGEYELVGSRVTSSGMRSVELRTAGGLPAPNSSDQP